MKKKLHFILALLIMMFMLQGCSAIDSLRLRYGMINQDFEFLKSEDLESIIIQSVRDKGFRFVVTDRIAIGDLYSSLKKADATEEKSVFAPDYTFEFHMIDGTVIEYSYVAGVSNQDKGNFYSDEKSYRVPERIDNDLIRNLYTLRKPKYFEDVYYDSLSELTGLLKEEYPGMSIGIRIYNDVDTLKYQISRDIEDFRQQLLEKGAMLLSSGEKTDIVLEVKTQGYKTNVFKAVVSLRNEKDYTKRSFYIYGKYSNDISKWDTIISEEKPEGF